MKVIFSIEITHEKYILCLQLCIESEHSDSFLDALASLDFMLSVSHWVIHLSQIFKYNQDNQDNQ